MENLMSFGRPSKRVYAIFALAIVALVASLAIQADRSSAATGPLYISEVLYNPPGADTPNEYVEIRGAANTTIPAGTFLIGIESDGDGTNNTGDVQTIFNLSSKTIGSNGFLLLRQASNTYTVDPGANALSGTTTGFGGLSGFSADSSGTDIENTSVTFWLIENATAPTLTTDIDSDNDGIPNGAFFTSSTIQDSIGVLDSGTNDRAYGEINYTQDTTGTLTGTRVTTGFLAGYVGRSAETTGSAASDWVASNIAGTAPNFKLGAPDTNPSSFANLRLNHIGSTNFPDTTDPTLTFDDGEADDVVGPNTTLTYTVTFDEDIDASTVTTADFDNAGTASITKGMIDETSPGVFSVQVTPTNTGTAVLRVPTGAVVEDTSGNRLAVPVQDDTTVTVENTPPMVGNITRATSSPTNAASVDYTVTFNESVMGVDTSDFTLATTGVSGASVTNVSGSGDTRTVTVDTGAGDGAIRLDLTDDDTIVDAANNPLGGTGGGNGDFTTGEVYTIDKTAPTLTFDDGDADDVVEPDTTLTYTLTFDEDIAEGTVTAADFDNDGTAAINIGSISETTPTSGVFGVEVTPTSQGSLKLRIPSGAVIKDTAGNDLATPVSDDDTVRADVAPTVTLSGENTSDEGQTKTYTYTVTDPGDGSSLAITEQCGANGAKTDTPDPDSFECTFPDGPASSTVSVSADDDSGTGSDSVSVDVANIRPSISLTGSANAEEGDTKIYTYIVTDPGQDTHTVAEGCGANGTKTDTPAADSFECTFPDGPATTDVTAMATDSDGATDTDNQKVTVSVANLAPTVELTGDSSASEGDTKVYTYTVSDLGDDSNPIITEQCGANGAKTDTSDPDSFECTFPDGPASSEVSVSADDGNETGSDSIVVDVSNVKPSISLTGPANAEEGDTKIYTYTVTDPGQDTHTVAEGCGANGTKTDTPDLDHFECTFPDGPATTDVTATATDSDGDTDTDNQKVTVSVANLAPTVELTGADDADEGDTKVYAYTVSDPGDDSPPTITESCGANGTYTDTLDPDHFECLFPDGPASSEVSVGADDGNDTGSDTISVDVSNVKPSISLTGAATAEEGDTKTYTYIVTDPGQDTHTVAEGCGANGTKTDTPAADSFECTFPDGPATTDVTAMATDSDGATDTDNQKVTVTVANVALTVELTGANAADEGDTKVYTYTVSDPGDDANPNITESCGANGTRNDTPDANHFECIFPDGAASSEVSVSADDGSDTGSDSVSVDVANVDPVVTAADTQSAFAGEGKDFDLGSFKDPGTDGDWQVTVDWGDSSADTTFAAASAGSLAQKPHTYANAGNRTITVTVAEDGASAPSDSGSFQVSVVGEADLSITKTDSADPVPVNGNFSYTLEVSNASGAVRATNVTLTDTLPNSVALRGDLPPGCSGTSTITCDLGTIRAGTTKSRKINVKAPQTPGKVANKAKVNSPRDSSDANDTETTRVVAEADLTITKTDSRDPVPVNGNFGYKLTVSNAGGAGRATGVTVTDTLPEGVTLREDLPDGCSGTSTITCNFRAIIAGESKSRKIKVKAPQTPGRITNKAKVSSPRDLTNSRAIESTRVTT